MALSNAGKDALLNGLASAAGHASLHTGDPSTTGANEVTGGTYAREVLPWDAAASGVLVSDGAIVFDVPAATTISYVGYWSAATAGTFYGARELDEAQTFATAGTYTIAAGNLSESIS
jgi:hypothetical protein